MKKLKLLLVVLSIITISCQKDDDVSSNNDLNQTPNSSTFSENFGSQISRTFLGNVVDNTNNPLSGVLIKIGNQTATTDNNGVFIIQDATVNERFGYVTAEKAGFIHASRAVAPTEGTNKVTIMMLPETIVGTTSSGNQDTISLANGASVSLQGDYIKEDGTSYSGNVNVIIHHLDPIDENMQSQMPGMLYAADDQNDPVILRTFGMLAVELRGDNGEDLNLAEDSSAEITVPLDASLLADAPSTIPLWYFDEINGYWIEDGEATLIGNTYVGSVTHFSFWNVDIKADSAYLCITVNDENDNPLSNIEVNIKSDFYGTRSGITNEIGEVCGYIPGNEPLELIISGTGDCSTSTIYFQNIGPFSQDSNIEITIPNSPVATSESIEGQFLTCEGEPVTNGYVIIEYLNQNYVVFVPNGNFNISFIRCTNALEFNVQAYDVGNNQQTNIYVYSLSSPSTQIGTITSCVDSEEFIAYSTSDGVNVAFTSGIEGSQRPYILIPNDPNSIVPALNISVGLSPVNSIQNSFAIFGFLDENELTGEYGWNLDLENGTPGLIILGNPNDNLNISQNNNDIIFNVIEIGEVGEFIDLTFEGSYQDFDGNSLTIEGVAHVIRDE